LYNICTAGNQSRRLHSRQNQVPSLTRGIIHDDDPTRLESQDRRMTQILPGRSLPNSSHLRNGSSVFHLSISRTKHAPHFSRPRSRLELRTSLATPHRTFRTNRANQSHHAKQRHSTHANSGADDPSHQVKCCAKSADGANWRCAWTAQVAQKGIYRAASCAVL
jgi:hypothetical protein